MGKLLLHIPTFYFRAHAHFRVPQLQGKRPRHTMPLPLPRSPCRHLDMGLANKRRHLLV